MEIYLYPTAILVLEGVCGQHHILAALPPGKDPVPIVQGLGGPRAWSGWV